MEPNKKVTLEKLHFDVLIDADTNKVYTAMLAAQPYSEWTSVFNPTSRYEGSWEKGSTIYFIGSGEDGKEGGMVSRINENIPNKFVSIEHFGILKDGQEVTSGEEVDKWAGGFEDYSFEEVDGKTRVSVAVDVTPEFRQYMIDNYPVALEKLKEICER